VILVLGTQRAQDVHMPKLVRVLVDFAARRAPGTLVLGYLSAMTLVRGTGLDVVHTRQSHFR
jgi:hypothetical protein